LNARLTAASAGPNLSIEEKPQRVAEALLGSVSPTQLMAGRLLANVGVSMDRFSARLEPPRPT
jgi:ABC-type Na+ efflux pump permease subunit